MKRKEYNKLLKYWERNKIALTQKMRSHVPSYEGLNDRELFREFKNDVEARLYAEKFSDVGKQYFTRTNLSVTDAIKQTTNSRAFISQSERYSEWVKREIRYDPDMTKRMREFSRDKLGRFTRYPKPNYLGAVYFDGTEWQKYSFTNENGDTIYYYKQNSPSGENYAPFLSEEDL